jgi:hypothetical protein
MNANFDRRPWRKLGCHHPHSDLPPCTLHRPDMEHTTRLHGLPARVFAPHRLSCMRLYLSLSRPRADVIYSGFAAEPQPPFTFNCIGRSGHPGTPRTRYDIRRRRRQIRPGLRPHGRTCNGQPTPATHSALHSLISRARAHRSHNPRCNRGDTAVHRGSSSVPREALSIQAVPQPGGNAKPL